MPTFNVLIYLPGEGLPRLVHQGVGAEAPQEAAELATGQRLVEGGGLLRAEVLETAAPGSRRRFYLPPVVGALKGQQQRRAKR